MSLLFTGATSHRVDLAAQAGSLGITRGTLLLWLYVPSAASGALATLTDPVASVLRNNLNITTTGTVIRFTLDLATTDLDVQAALANFGAWGTGKWVRVALQWATPTEASGGTNDQKLLIGDLTTGVAEPSSYNSRTAGAGALSSTDATSFWKIGNRRQNDSPAPGRIAYAALFDRSAGSQMTTAEMDAWFQWPQAHGAAWMFELGADLAGGNPNDLTGHGHHGTITGATVADHPPMNPFGMARWAALESARIAPSTQERQRRWAHRKRMRARRDEVVVLTQSGPPIIDGVLAIPITYGLSATGTVSAAGATIDGTLSIPIAYGLSLAGTVVAGPAAINGVLAIPIAYGLAATGTVQAPASGATEGGWIVPVRLSSRYLRAGNDFSARIGPVRGRQVSPPSWIPYPGATVTCWLARPAAPLTALGGLVKTVTLTGAAGELALDATEIDAVLATLAPAATPGERFLLVVTASADFQRSREVFYATLAS